MSSRGIVNGCLVEAAAQDNCNNEVEFACIVCGALVKPSKVFRIKIERTRSNRTAGIETAYACTLDHATEYEQRICGPGAVNTLVRSRKQGVAS